ncbi:MAG: pyridoxal-phosphate dependent enzyme [Pseudomonadota bacterium]
MQITENSWRGRGLPEGVLADVPFASDAAGLAEDVVAARLIPGQTPLVQAEGLGCETWIKDERGRMGMGSFKALGAAYVIAHDAMATRAEDQATALTGRTYVTASAGNHGLSLAFGAKRFGARAVVFIAETVPESFADRLRAHGAEVERAGAEYEAAMAAAMQAAEHKGWTLLSDSSWAGYYDRPHRLMEGYLVMAAEAARQMPAPPTHIFLQAGVGGLACACALHFREVWGDAPKIIVVEPDRAPALEASIRAGDVVETTGAVSAMGRLDCKVPSFIALKQLAQDADQFVLISEEEAQAILPLLAGQNLASTPSGAAGIACLREMGLGEGSRALCFLSEQADP